MMFKLPYVPDADDLVDRAFRAGAKEAKKVRSTRKPRERRLLQSEVRRVEIISKILVGDLRAVVKYFPSYEQLPSFYRRLLDIRVDGDRYKKSLGAVQWCADKIDALSRKSLSEMRRGRDPSKSKHFLGKSSSYVKQVSLELERLVEIKGILLSFPSLKDEPTLVVAGYPNSGKSTFVRNLTGSKVEVNVYPFTTKELSIGRTRIRHREYQVIDSPGLLDRPMGDRNEIELQAALALEELADRILFLVDPTQELKPQLSLIREIKKSFSAPLYVAVTKSDVASEEQLDAAERQLRAEKGTTVCAVDGAECRRVFEWVFG